MIGLEEAHESGHVFLAHLAAAEVKGALADRDGGTGYTRIAPFPTDDDPDRLALAKGLHIMALI